MNNNAQQPIAARAPADSVTAPAGGGVAGSSMREEFEAYWRSKYAPLPMNTRLHDDGRYGDPTIQQEWESWRAIHTPTPPAQAADSVLEDAALLQEARTALWQPANVDLCERIDAYLDAARKQGGAQ